MMRVVKSGRPWRMLPKDFPPWQTVYGRFRRGRLDGRWSQAMKALREEARRQAGRNSEPHRFTFHQERRKRGQRGDDAGKKTKGRKQHIAVDTMGFILSVVVHSAGIQDRTGARAVLLRLFRWRPNIQKIFADGGYTGKLIGWTATMLAVPMEIVKRSDVGKFVVLPKRWIVERTFAWRALS